MLRKGSVVYYLHGDHLGSTSLTTCGSGSTCGGNGTEVSGSRTLYYPYGEVRWPTGGSTLPTDYTFTGQRNESSFGLLDYNARYYDPALGRFIQADTIVPSPANPQSLNRYSYVLNSPLRYTDPTGHAHWVGEDGDTVPRVYTNPRQRQTLRGNSTLSAASALGSSTQQSVATRPSFGSPCNPATDGVIIRVSHPANLAVRTESVAGGGIDGLIGSAGVEYRRVGIYPFGSPAYYYHEVVAHAGVGLSIPHIGGATMGAEWGPEGVSPSYDLGAMGGELSLQEGQIMIGYVGGEGFTRGARIGLEGELGHNEWFVTTRETFDYYGGAQAFAKAYSPGGNASYAIYQGTWDPSRGCRTGFDVALTKAVDVWGLTVTVVGK